MSSRFHFKHFQSRLLVFFLLPLLVVLAAVFVAVTGANTRNALDLINSDLATGAGNFLAALEERNATLAIAGDALSSDFAFRQAYSTSDGPTILSAMNNLLGRLINADLIVMVEETDSLVKADTLRPAQMGKLPEWLYLIEAARALDRAGAYPEAADVVILDSLPYHLTVLPLFAPDLVAWIALGFELDQRFTENFQQTIAAQVSVLFRDADNGWHINSSTMPAETLPALQSQFNTMPSAGLSGVLRLAGEDYVTLARPISQDGLNVEVVLQRSLTDQLAPFEALKQLLFSIFALALALLGFSLLLISRKVTRPVLELVQGAKRIEQGDFLQRVNIPLHDEIGELAEAFNNMAKGLAEKERVRDLLGKVVSPEIATELLSKDIELGGEEREVTILFADLRGFTTLCEGKSPRDILSLVNEYFSVISGVIEANGGVVDKYIGDAVMALFGAPIAHADAPSRAVRTALDMMQALDGINAGFVARGLSPIAIGIGINTDNVVVGNMGSVSRLNYTVIGDGVNLASRLEGLTKDYETGIIVSERTARAAPEFNYRELGLVRVKGKQEAVQIFAVLNP